MTQTIEQLQAKVAELEEENARLKAESRDACLGLNDYYGRKLTAEQLNNKRLREALEFLNARIGSMDLGGVVERALSLSASTEALDKYVAEKVKESPKVKELTAQIAALELEVTSLRSVMADVIKAHGYTGGTPIEVMSTQFTTTTLNELIEKGI